MHLLLDSHIPPAVARELRRHGVDAVALRDWRDGCCLNASDEEILAVAMSEDRVFVTYDCKTIPAMLSEWAETGRHHAGVILLDENTVRPNNRGSLFRTLHRHVVQGEGKEWEDQVVFLRTR